jgi:hypothetical protein
LKTQHHKKARVTNPRKQKEQLDNYSEKPNPGNPSIQKILIQTKLPLLFLGEGQGEVKPPNPDSHKTATKKEKLALLLFPTTIW